jgi:hypothetical protein
VLEPALSVQAPTFVQLGRVKVAEANLNPAIGPAGRSNAEPITIAHVADDAAEDRVTRWERRFARIGERWPRTEEKREGKSYPASG